MSSDDATVAVLAGVVVGNSAPEDSQAPTPKLNANGSDGLKKAKGLGKGKITGKGRGKGKGKAKCKGNGKGKGKRGAHAKTKARAKEHARAPEKDSGESAETETETGTILDRAAKVPKLSLKNQVTSSIANRDIEEVLAEAKAEVKVMQESIEKAAAEERNIEEQLQALSKKLADASAKVEDGMKQEEIALDKLRKSRESQIVATLGVAEARLNEDNVTKHMRTLELEVQARQQVTEFEEAKQAAREAAEAAKKALQEAKLREKEAAEAMRRAMKEQRQKAPTAIMDRVEGQEQTKDKDMVSAHKETLKASTLEIKAIEKMRLERERRREASLKAANGFCKRSGKGSGKGGGRVALSNSPSEDAVDEAHVVDAVDAH
eukprot:TRINITY_DN10887_c0_g2_i2.p1 TRINITY_DN10887_c0_g2~~TRINITY_DN10887_c0_g2_i2.p1  ORF type:complete len:395 (-),score=100.56 TRINITY_DN10887_c0_g2_i2:123-1253(-)